MPGTHVFYEFLIFVIKTIKDTLWLASLLMMMYNNSFKV